MLDKSWIMSIHIRMPCTDITELLTLILDHHDRVTAYTLVKRTCGGAVAGRGLIRDWVKHQDIDRVLALRGEQLLTEPARGPANEYLRLKHLFTVQAALRTYVGVAQDDDLELIEIESIEHSADHSEIRAVVKLSVLTEKIRACGLCGDNCGRMEG